jgi:small subunit ribosomal protein S6
MHDYEVAVLYHPDLEVDLSKAEAKFASIITSNKGEVVSSDSWGKRKLAYQIKKLDYAVYVICTVKLPAASVAKVEYTLNITDEVIRFLIVKIDHKERAKAEAAREDREKKAAERASRGEEDKADEEQKED